MNSVIKACFYLGFGWRTVEFMVAVKSERDITLILSCSQFSDDAKMA